MGITADNRKQSYEAIKPVVGQRQQRCLEALHTLGHASARQIAEYLYRKGLIPVPERNMVHPRLNELVALRIIEVAGKCWDMVTERNCAVYKLREGK